MHTHTHTHVNVNVNVNVISRTALIRNRVSRRVCTHTCTHDIKLVYKKDNNFYLRQ